MDITVTGRHIEATPALKDYAATRLEHVKVEFPRVLSAHFIFEVDKFRQIAELVLVCANHITIEAREVNEDLYAAIDKVVDKVARQLRKYKTKMQNHRPRTAKLTHVDEHVLTHDLHEEEGSHRVVQTEQFAIKPMFVDEAVMQLEMSERDQFMVFLNAETEKVNVLYRRKKGDFGLIQPTLA